MMKNPIMKITIKVMMKIAISLKEFITNLKVY